MPSTLRHYEAAYPRAQKETLPRLEQSVSSSLERSAQVDQETQRRDHVVPPAQLLAGAESRRMA